MSDAIIDMTFKERIALLRRGASEMRKDRDPRWNTIADWADLEAATLGETEAFIDLFSAAIEKTSGIKGYLRLSKNEAGEPVFHSDTSDAALAAVVAYLGDE